MFNGEMKETDSNGTAIFYFVCIGTNQQYVVNATGFIPQIVDLDVSGTESITVTMEAI